MKTVDDDTIKTCIYYIICFRGKPLVPYVSLSIMFTVQIQFEPEVTTGEKMKTSFTVNVQCGVISQHAQVSYLSLT